MKKRNGGARKSRRALTVEQQREFIDYVAKNPFFFHWYPFFVFLLGTGCRIGEAIGIRWDDVDMKKRTININHSLTYYTRCDIFYRRKFFLMDQLRKTGTDGLLKKELANGKLMIGESAGAIICSPSIQYIEQMDEKPEDYSQEDDAGLDLIDFYVLPHYLTAPFKKVTEKIMTEFSDLNLCPINNRQGIVIDGEGSKVICKD